MIQNVLRELGGIGLYGVFSVCLFFLVFTLALVRALMQKKPFVRSMSLLPLQDGQVAAHNPGENTHE
jgi:hypothetical protein